MRPRGHLLSISILSIVLIGSFAGPQAAAKLIQEEETFYLRWGLDSFGICGDSYLSVIDEADRGNTCWYYEQVAQEALILTGTTLTREWPASDAMPLSLDATRPITGEITVHAPASVAATLVLELSTNKGAIGETTIPFQATPVAPYVTLPFEMEIPPELNRKKTSSLVLSTTIRGVVVSAPSSRETAAWIELDSPPSFVTIPVLTQGRP